MKKLFLLSSILVFLFLYSCQNESFETASENLTLRAATDNVDPLISQLSGIPVNIVLNPGATNGNRFVSVHPTKRDVELLDRDDNSLRQRFNISVFNKSATDGEYYKIEVLGGLSKYVADSYLSLPYYDKTYSFINRNYPGDAGSTEQTWFINKVKNSDYYEIGMNVFNKEKKTYSTLYLSAQTNNKIGLRLEVKDTNNEKRQQWQFVPLEEFSLESVKYLDVSTNVASRQVDFAESIRVTNGTALAQTLTTTFQKKATISSSFSKTEGVSFSIATESKAGIPLFSEGKLNTSITTTQSFTYSNSEVKEDARIYNFPIEVSPFTRLVAKITIAQYNASIAYEAKLKSKRTGLIITVNGVWNGIIMGDLDYNLESYTLDGKLIKAQDLTGVQTAVVKM